MRILLLVDCYLPSRKASAQLMHDLALELMELGHQVAVMAPDDQVRGDVEHDCVDAVDVVRVRCGKLKGVSNWIRAINEARLPRTFWTRGKRFFRAARWDLIVYYSPTIFWGALVDRLRKRYSCPAYLILRDIFPQWAVDAGQIRPNGPIHNYFLRKETQNYRAADIIGVQSPANLQYFTSRQPPVATRIEVLFNWARAQTVGSGSDFRRQWNLEDKVVFFYGGNIGVAQDIDAILRLASKMHGERDAYFLLVGEGSEVDRVQREISRLRLTNIAVRPAVPQGEYLRLMNEFDVGLVSLRRDLTTQNFPGKLLGYMQCSKPILASINPGNDLQQILEENEAGLVSISGEDDILAEHAMALLRDRGLRIRMGTNARRLLDSRFSAAQAARQILSHFE